MGRIDKNPILSEDSVVAAKIFKNIAGLWKLTIDEQLKVLGGMTEQEFKNCFVKSNKELSSGALDRISYIMGIYKCMQMLFPTKENANEWVRTPNGDEPFRGKSALDKMLSGNIRDFKAVREYLDSMRSGWL